MARKRPIKVWVNDEEKSFLDSIKQLKTDSATAFLNHCVERGITPKTVKEYWDKSSSDFSIKVRPGEDSFTWTDFKDRLVRTISKHAPEYIPISRTPMQDEHLLTISLADIHFNKLCKAYATGEEYNIEIASRLLHESVEGLVKKSSGYNIDKILLIIGNDILHTDNVGSSATTSGTPQDSDSFWFLAFQEALTAVVKVIEKLLSIADLHVMHNTSNHDYMSGWMLAVALHSWFHTSENITWNIDQKHRKYFRYGSTLIGSTHGDGVKAEKLGHYMPYEAKSDWSECEFYYFHYHHIHHKKATDELGVCIESFRSISASDQWHHKAGYQHAPRGMEAFLYSKAFGQSARLTHYVTS